MASSGEGLLKKILIILTINVIMIVRIEIELTIIMTNMALMINILEIGLASIEYSHTMYYIVSLDKSSLPVLAFYG